MIFIRENYPQLSFSEDEPRKRKVGILGTVFPKSWLTPDPKPEDIGGEERSSFMARQIL